MGLRILCEPCLDCLNTITAEDTDTAIINVRIANIQGNSGTVGVDVDFGVGEGEDTIWKTVVAKLWEPSCVLA